MKPMTSWVTSFKKKRNDYGVTQNKIATLAGITREHLYRIENEKTMASDSLKEKLNKELEVFNPDSPLEMLFDYVRIRFPTDDVVSVIQKLLRLNIDYMIYEDYAYYSYQDH